MNKKVNSIVFILGGTIVNVLLAILFILGFCVLALWGVKQLGDSGLDDSSRRSINLRITFGDVHLHKTFAMGDFPF